MGEACRTCLRVRKAFNLVGNLEGSARLPRKTTIHENNIKVYWSKGNNVTSLKVLSMAGSW